MAPRVSIVIVALNEAHNLARTLEAIHELKCDRGDYEVIVVDGGSADGTAQVAQEGGARLIVAKEKNIPASRNIGVANAQARIIAFVDADCLVGPEWLVRGLRHFEGGGDAVVGAPAMGPETGTWVQRLWADHWRAKLAVLHDRGQNKPYRLLSTRNLFTTRRVFEAVGGFDEKLDTGEDYYFCFKAHQQGFPQMCDLDLSVVHIGEPASLSEFFQQQMWHGSNVVLSRLLREGAAGGLNALVFGLYMAVALVGVLAGGVLGLLGMGWGWAVAVVGCLLAVGAPMALAVRTAYYTGQWSRAPGYTVIYLAYGLARVATLWRGLWIIRKRPKGKLEVRG